MTELEEIKKFLDEQDDILAPIQKALNLSYWHASLSGKKYDYDTYEEFQKDIEKILHNKETFEKIKVFLEQEIDDSIIKRRLELLHKAYLGSQGDIDLIKEIIKVSTKIEREFNTYLPKINGREHTANELCDILKTKTDSEKLKQAWEASKEIGGIIKKDLLDLVRLRNKLAISLGFENYYTLSLELSEQKEQEIESLFNYLVDSTDESFREVKKDMDEVLSKKYNIPITDLKPWHYQDKFFQEPPKTHEINLDEVYTKDIVEITKRFYESIGFDINNILDKSDLYEKPGKYPHAYCIDINRKGDVRTMQNIKNNEKWMDTILHELGHGVYNQTLGQQSNEELPHLLRDQAHIFTTEAIALLFGRLSKNKEFIEKYCDVEPEMLIQIENELVKISKAYELVFTRWSQVMFNFERELYKNPEQDLNKLWWNLVKRYQLIDFVRDKPDWASKIHLSSHPVYYHNYLLGKLLASQLHNHITKNILKKDSLHNIDYSGNKEIAEYLKNNIFAPGKKYKWDEMIKKATGEYLTPKYFVEQFVGSTSQPL